MTNLENLPRPTVRLSGSDGNAFMVISKTIGALRKAGWQQDQLAAFQAEVTSGDYDHVLTTCMKYAEVE